MTRDVPAADRLIVALDVDTREEALEIVRSLGDAVTFYKVGLQLFIEAGMPFVRELIAAGKKVFLDLKIDDIPRTVEAAVDRASIGDGVRLFTLQGNAATARAARKGRGAREYPKLMQVTYLSSWNADDFRDSAGLDRDLPLPPFDEMVERRARTALAAGCDGVIASGTSVERLRRAFPDAIIVTPGIRPAGGDTHDHKRSLTPYDAIRYGADYLVVGRPLRDASDPPATARAIVADIEKALAERR